MNEKVFPWHPPNHSYCQVRRNEHSILFRTQEIVCSPYAIALAFFFAVRSRSPSRAFCSSSLLFLSYLLHPSSLPMSFFPTLGVAPSPPPVTILSARSDLLSCRQSAFPSLHVSSQTPPISSRAAAHTNVPPNSKCTWIRMRKTVHASLISCPDYFRRG